MRMKIAGLVVAGVLALGGCSKQSAPAGGQQATVTLKDGTTFSGAVTANSNDAITLQAAGGGSRTYPMTQVAGVQYADAPPADGGTQPATSSTPGPAPSRIVTRTLSAGTTIQVRNNDTINSQTAREGQAYSAVVATDVLDAEGGVVIPKGSNATLLIKAASDQGRVKGRSDLVVDLDSVEVGGRRYELDTNDIVRQGKQGIGRNKRTGLFTGGGAILGTVLGAVAGGGTGAAIGAGAGAAAGAGVQTLTRGKAVRIPSETLLHFRLEAPAIIREAQ